MRYRNERIYLQHNPILARMINDWVSEAMAMVVELEFLNSIPDDRQWKFDWGKRIAIRMGQIRTQAEQLGCYKDFNLEMNRELTARGW